MMSKLQEFKLSALLLIIGIFFLGGCFFSKNNTVTFKTNGGSEVKSINVKSGNKIEAPKNPTKDGYVFDGWYSGNEEFNFDDEINDDITIVAKWKKLEIIEEEVVEEVVETTTTAKKTSKKKKTVKKVTSKKKKSANKVKTTKKAKKKVSNTKVEINTTTTQTVINTTSEVITTTSEVITTTSEVITTTAIQESSYFKIERDIDPTYNIILNNNSNIEENSNIALKISNEEFAEFITSNIDEWYIISDNGSVLNINKVDESYVITGATEKANSIAIEYNNKVIIISEDNNKWTIDRPEVAITNGLNIKYFKDINTAINNYQEGDTIKLLKDITLSEQIIIDKYVIIDGDDHTINSELNNYILSIKDLTDDTKEIKISNLRVSCNSFINIEENTLISHIDLDNSIVILNNNGSLSNNDSLIINGDIKSI